ncbi:hypothetical protein FB45DRAFT_902235 [Roridomyces roridus]|uniref:MYND-type domain-containing protein n=1 Tax=Roridomyces roridus TaxID=1738132 RepID=A0AAD7C3G7_9AGAR|nr:hypothetical protein FB45DRAFT_902235 [Roridomyces roridus]
MVLHISRFLGVADVCTPRGLKQCHEAFNAVSSKLDALYAQTREFRSDCASADRLSSISADRLAAAIILTFSRIAVDAKLRKRIFAETEFLSKATALLSSPDLSVGATVMKALHNITTQHDILIVKEILPVLPMILDYSETNLAGLRDEWLDDGVYVLTRCAAGLFLDKYPDPELVAQVPLPRILRFSLSVIRLPKSTSFAVRHFAFFCYKMTEHLATLLLSNSDLIDFLVAAIRSRDLSTRFVAQYTLIQLYATSPRDETRTGRCEPDLAHPGYKWKSFLKQVADAFTELDGLIHTFDLVHALDEKIPHSHFDFGLAFSIWIQRNSTLVRGRLEKGPLGHIHLAETFETCEAALRRDGSARAELAADVIELLLAQDKDKGSSFAHSCVEKHPSVAYFYYASALGSPISPISAVLFAEKGLQCRPITEFLRLEFLCLAATCVYHIIKEMLKSSPLPNEEHLRKANVFVEKGLSYVNAFLDSTPIEHPRTAEMAAMSTLLTFLSTGHTLNEEELQTVRGELSTACEFRLPKEYTTLEEIFCRMPIAWPSWEAAMSRQPLKVSPQLSTGNQANVPDTAADVNEDEWLQRLNVSSPDVVSLELGGEKFGVKRNCGDVLLHACTRCGKRSAVLKRCAGCQRARFCNDTCQKSDWKNHREICKASRVASDN